MPGYDGTGPLGKGAMTGRAGGTCSLRATMIMDETVRVTRCGLRYGSRRGPGKPTGRGFGRSGSWRRSSIGNRPLDEELGRFQVEARQLELSLQAVAERIEELHRKIT